MFILIFLQQTLRHHQFGHFSGKLAQFHLSMASLRDREFAGPANADDARVQRSTLDRMK
jgi:hypothetical protein